jgi:hypothetical protein
VDSLAVGASSALLSDLSSAVLIVLLTAGLVEAV